MKSDKRINRLLSKPRDYTFSEAQTLLASLGYKLMTKGATSGSRISFYRERDGAKIMLHKPHPGNEMKSYAVLQLIENLKERGDIDEQ